MLTGVPRATPNLANGAAADADDPRADTGADSGTDADSGRNLVIGADGSGNAATACSTTARESLDRCTSLP